MPSPGGPFTPQGLSTIKIHRSSLDSAEQALRDTIEERVAIIECGPRFVGSDDSFFIADLAEVQRQYASWKAHLPFVRPYYAVKCNPDPALLRCLMQLDVGFDCASVEEMRTVLRLGARSSSIIYANPCKASWALAFAGKIGVPMTTFDNLDELDAIKIYMPDVQLILRIFANDPSAAVALGAKFGAHIESTQALLMRAKELGLNIVGVSFHVGTGARDPNAMQKAIADARLVWAAAESLGFHMSILDIGGGFQASETDFQIMANTVTESVSAASFPQHTTVIAEPGRFFARSVYTLVCRVISRRRHAEEWPSNEPEMLYQNDGIYGNFMNVLTENEICEPTLVKSGTNKHLPRHAGLHHYSIWGPTCDSTDCVVRKTNFACEVKVDDWLVYKNMGAYTWVTATRFNGFLNQPKTFYTFIKHN